MPCSMVSAKDIATTNAAFHAEANADMKGRNGTVRGLAVAFLFAATTSCLYNANDRCSVNQICDP